MESVLPQSKTLIIIYHNAALVGNYMGMEYIESVAQLDKSYIPLHIDILIERNTDLLDAFLRVCNRPGYRRLLRYILNQAYPKGHQNCKSPNCQHKLKYEQHRPFINKLREEYLDLVVGKCDYSPEDLILLSKTELGPFPAIGESKVCRADLLMALKESCGNFRIDCIHTSCEMAFVMKPGLNFDLRKCSMNRSFKQRKFNQPAKTILQTSRNISEVIAVLDAHSCPFEGLQYIENCVHEAAVYLFDSHDMDQDRSRQKRVYDALGQIDIIHLQNQEPPRWKDVAVACRLALRHGCAHVSRVSARLEPPSSLVTEYALARDESVSDIQKLYCQLGPLAPIALCATKMFSGGLDDAQRIARDPRAPETAKYHQDVFSQIALCIARNAIRLVKNNVSLTQIAWVFEYLPRK